MYQQMYLQLFITILNFKEIIRKQEEHYEQDQNVQIEILTKEIMTQ